MKQSTWEKGQGCYNAIMIPILVILGIIAPIMLIIFINEPGPKDVGAIVCFGFFVLMDVAVITWFVYIRVKRHDEKKQISEKYHGNDKRKARSNSSSGDAKYMKICPRCLWIPHSACDWIEHKGTEQDKCYYCNIPLATTNCTEEEFNRSDELKELVFEYFASQKAYDREIYEKRIRNDLALKKQMLERRRREEQQNQLSPQCQSSQVTQPQIPQTQERSPMPTLTTCPVCGGKVSTAATACPHCGQPLSAGRIVLH